MIMREVFANPPAAYRQAPFWFWNERLDKDLLSWQIRQMQDKGLGGFVMHARHGLITPYLSAEWMDCIRHCCEEAKQRGMLAWAYDERDWPSGPAGGAVIARPENRMRYLRLDQASAPLADGETCVARYAQQRGKMLRTANSGDAAAWQAVCFECPAILWFESYLDTLSEEACQAFIQSTYDRYEQALGDLRALGLAGFFTDEPALSTYPDDLRRIPWTPKLPDAFLAAKGYDLLEQLPALFAPGEAGAQVRYDYWDVATSLFSKSFVQAIAAWCDTRGLQLIGHPLGEEPLFFQFRCLGDIFKYLKHQHMPGMDHLGITVGKGHPLAMTPKLVASAALLAGRERTMTETFGESGWGLSLREMKWMADWQLANGINYFIPHAFFYSVSGRRKRDSPPSEFYQAPFWPYYRFFADYTARVSAVMTGGEHTAKIAVLYPMGSVWADFVPGEAIPPAVQAMETAFAPLGETLLAMHRDFVIVDEESLAGAQIDANGFTVNGVHFEALILPQMTSIHYDTYGMLRQLAASGRVVAAGANTLRLLTSTVSATVQLADLQGIRMVDAANPGALADALSWVTPDVIIENAPAVQYLHRRKEGVDFFFFANTADTPADTTLSLESTGEAERWDPETGNIEPIAGQRAENDRLLMPLYLPPMGSLLISVDPARQPIDYVETPFQPEQRIPLCQDDCWHFTPFNGNLLALRRWHFSTEMRHKVMELRYTTEFIITENIANLRLILDGLPEHPIGVPPAARPIVAQETYPEILMDGKPITRELYWEIDARFRVLDLADCAQPGIRRLEIVIRNQGWFPQPGLEEYVWLAGDFMAEFDGNAPRLSPCRGVRSGPWEKQGFPGFSGTAAYAADIPLPDSIVGKRVFLDAGNVGDILDVEINGNSAGVRAWPPYRVDITRHIWPGRNNLVVLKVTNSAHNVFEGPDKGRPSGLLEDVFIEFG